MCTIAHKFVQTHEFDQFFVFLSTLLLVDTPCIQLMMLKVKKILPLLKHFLSKTDLPNENFDPF